MTPVLSPPGKPVFELALSCQRAAWRAHSESGPQRQLQHRSGEVCCAGSGRLFARSLEVRGAHWAGGSPEVEFQSCRPGKSELVLSFLVPCWTDAPWQSSFCNFYKTTSSLVQSPQTHPRHSRYLGNYPYLPGREVGQKEGRGGASPSAAPQPRSVSRALFSYLQPHLSFPPSFQSLHLISPANLSRRKFGLHLPWDLLSVFAAGGLGPAGSRSTGRIEDCPALRGSEGPLGPRALTVQPPSEAGPAVTSTKGCLVSLSGPTRLRENREPFVSCHCLRSGFIRIEAVQAAAREIPSILKMTRLNLLDQDSCEVQGEENYTNSSASSVNGRSLPAQGHVT